jgi:hypothetical protein
VRRASLHLAVVISAVALFLALPILDFGAISARNQLSRLETGKVSAEDFDYAALRWEFGDAGRRALARLTKSDNAVIAKLAGEARAQTARVWGTRAVSEFDVRVQPANPALERLVRDWLRANPWGCSETCVALDLGPVAGGKRRIALVNGPGYQTVELPTSDPYVEVARPAPRVTLRPDSKVEIRTLSRRYIVVDGQPIGQPLEDTAIALDGPPPPR